MDAPLARHLTRFTAPPPPAFDVEIEALTEEIGLPLLDPEPFVETVPAEPEITLTESAFAMHLAEARQAGSDETSVACAEERAVLEAAHEAMIAEATAAARAEVVAEDAKALAATIEAAFDRLGQELSGLLADALRPLLGQAAADRTLEALVVAIGHLLDDPKHPVLVVRGPAERIAALRQALGDRPGVNFVEAATADVEMTADGLRVTTQLKAALAAIAAPGQVI